MLLGFAFGIIGIKKNLPYIEESDESFFVPRAVRMASTGNINPEWFGNPGSTTIYPIMVGSHIWHALAENGTFLTADPKLQLHFNEDSTDYYLIGRLLSLLYALLSIPLTYLLGKRIFNSRIALIGAWLLITYATYWVFAQWVRTDLAATFWSMLSLWLCVRVYDQPSWKRYMWAGLAIGLSIASRYFMVTLGSVIFIIWAIQFWNAGSTSQRIAVLKHGIVGFLAVVLGFAISTPYFFLDFKTAVDDILLEARNEHLGADGLSKWGNIWWYLTVAFPQSISLPQTILAGIGIVLSVLSRKPARLFIVAYTAVFLFAISQSPLHWARWTLQLLPLLALFTAYAINTAVVFISQRLASKDRTRTIILLTTIVLISILPLYALGRFKLKQSTPSTRIMAREWIIENIPNRSKIGEEAYTAPLKGTDYIVVQRFSLTEIGTLETFIADGYAYLVISSGMYDRYYAEPERYATEVAFYDSLFNEAELLQQFEPSITKNGPSVVIFKLPQP